MKTKVLKEISVRANHVDGSKLYINNNNYLFLFWGPTHGGVGVRPGWARALRGGLGGCPRNQTLSFCRWEKLAGGQLLSRPWQKTKLNWAPAHFGPGQKIGKCYDWDPGGTLAQNDKL